MVDVFPPGDKVTVHDLASVLGLIMIVPEVGLDAEIPRTVV